MEKDLSSAATAYDLLRAKLFSPLGSSSHVDTSNIEEDFKVLPESRKIAFNTVHDLLQRTILHGEGNSLLVIGPRGCCKSWLLDKVMKRLEADRKCKNNFIKVQLSGLVHTDDRLALLAIARQLDVQHLQGDKISMSFSAALECLLDTLNSGSQANQSIVFILDEFDLFAHHKNQTLLYNLFDASQSAANPIAVVGVSCRLDAVELLEKRVKSRFSHRQVTLFSDFTFEEYVALFFSLLSLPVSFDDKAFLKRWNDHLKELVETKSVLEVLKRRFNTSPTVRSLISLLMMPVCRLSKHHPFLTPSDFVSSYQVVTKDSVSAILKGISILELCLIVAMKQIVQIKGDEPFNFQLVYSEYERFTQRSGSVEFFNKAVAMKAFEHLVSLEVVYPSEWRGKVMKEFQPMRLMLDQEQVRKTVLGYPNCPTDVARWGTSAGIVGY